MPEISMRKLASFDKTSASTVCQDNDQFSAKIFVLATIIGAFGLFLPIFVSDKGAVNYERNMDDERSDEIRRSINGGAFTQAVLTATVVAVTLASDGVLDAVYGSRFVSLIEKPRWLLLLALGLPNIVMYICHLQGDLTIGLFSSCTDMRELCIQAALLYFHYGMTVSVKVRSIIWLILSCNITAYNILAWDNFYYVGEGAKVFSFVLIGVSFLSVCALTVYRIVVLVASVRHGGAKAIHDNILGVAYTCCLAISILSKYTAFIVFTTAGGGLGGLYTCYTLVDVVVVLVLSTMHSRITKLESLTSENMLNVKRNFVRYISHEIRTPLNTVAMGIQYVKASMIDRSTGSLKNDICADEVCSMLEDVHESCNIAVEILNNILTYDKLESGNLVLTKQTVLARTFLSDALRPFCIQAANLGVKYEFQGTHMSPDLSRTYISVDVNKASQVFRNLVSNALKFTDRGGEVTVTSEIIYYSNSQFETSDRKEPALVVSVRDTGVGISRENQTRLFNEIIQFDAADLQNGNGSGLGLWLTNSIVNLHNGYIGVISTGVRGEGSTFTVKLPVVTEAPPKYDSHDDVEMGMLEAVRTNDTIRTIRTVDVTIQQTPPYPENTLPIENTNATIFPLRHCLVVDDSPTNRKFLTRLLKPYFDKQTTAENGQEAVDIMAQAMKTGNCDIVAVFMDSIMPVLNGIEASSEIRKLGYDGLLVGVTGNVLAEQIDDFTRNGADLVLPKPVDMRALEKMMHKHFGMHYNQ